MRSTAISFIATCVLLLPPSSARAQDSLPLVVMDRLGSAITVQANGGRVAISRGLGAVSGKSSLNLQWVMVLDSTLGLVFDEPVGAKGVYDKPYFRYEADMAMKALKPIAAFEVRILVFNVWKDFEGVLTFTQLEDLMPRQKKSFDRFWGYYGESQLRDHFISLAYIARVRYPDGTTIVADVAPVLKAAQAIQASITLQDLTPKPEPLPFAAPTQS